MRQAHVRARRGRHAKAWASAAWLLAAAGAGAAPSVRLAWPPTRYASAELVVHAGRPGQGPFEVRVRGRSLDVTATVQADAALRLPLPPEARCAPGVDACGIVVERLSGSADLAVVLQSPDTAGVPDTLLRTAHDSVRIPPPDECGRRHAVVSLPVSADLSEARTFASVVPADGPVTVDLQGSCTGASGVPLEFPEVLTVSCTAAGDDLTGAAVDADGPVVVLCGNVVAPLPDEPGAGHSGDLILDAPWPLEWLEEGATYLVPPLPRAASHAGLGDVVRLVAGAALTVRVRDDAGVDETLVLEAGEHVDWDTAGLGADRVLRLDADGPLIAWHLPKSRALRGTGDPAGIPIVPVELFAIEGCAFLPDGYSEGTHLVVVGTSPGGLLVDDAPAGGWVEGPAGLWWTLVELGEPPAGTGAVVALRSATPFGAWTVGQGGYKAHGTWAARAAPSPPPRYRVLRGTTAGDLLLELETQSRSWSDGTPSPRIFYRVEGAERLGVTRCAGRPCLSW